MDESIHQVVAATLPSTPYLYSVRSIDHYFWKFKSALLAGGLDRIVPPARRHGFSRVHHDSSVTPGRQKGLSFKIGIMLMLW